MFIVVSVFLFIFFLVSLLSKENAGRYRAIKGLRVEAF